MIIPLKKYALFIIVHFVLLLNHIPIAAQSGGFPVVNFPFKGPGGNPKLITDEQDNIYVFNPGYEEFLIDTPDVYGANLYIEMAKYNNKGQLLWVQPKIQLDYPYENTPDFIGKGPRPGQVLLKDSLIYITGRIMGTRPYAWFVYTCTLEGEPVDTAYIRLEEGFTPNVGNIFVGDEIYLLVQLRAQSFPSFYIKNLYKKNGNTYDLVRTYHEQDNYRANGVFAFSDDEFYTFTKFRYSPDQKYTIYKHNIDGEIIDYFEDDALARHTFVVGDTVFFYYEDFNVFHNDGFTGDKKYYDDYVPPMPSQSPKPTIYDFVRGRDGSIMAVGSISWFGSYSSFMHRIAPDGQSEYAWAYNPEVVPLNALWSIVEIESGYVIAGEFEGREYGSFMALIDKEGWLVSSKEHKIPDSQIQILLYPNPCLNDLFVEIEDIYEGRITIVDMQGTIVHYQQVTDSKTRIQTAHLPPGIYVLRWESAKDRTSASKKFIRME